MAKFARIIELENNEQVLLVKKINDEDSFVVDISIDLDNLVITATLDFGEKERKRDKSFNEYSEESALLFYNKMLEMTQQK